MAGKKDSHNNHKWGFPRVGVPFWGPHSKDYSIGGCTCIYGNFHIASTHLVEFGEIPSEVYV